MKWILVTRFLGPVLAFVILTCSCGASSPGGRIPTTAYLPYVESVNLESTYVESNSVTITLEMLAPMNPRILEGLQEHTVPTGSWIDVWLRRRGNVITLRPWVSEPLHSGPAVSEFSFDISAFAPGTYRLLVHTADSREWGGLSSQYDAGSPFGDIPEHPHAVYREYSFTVLPVEEDE
jgi:hypothetical protein